jgi:hypothetical protein
MELTRLLSVPELVFVQAVSMWCAVHLAERHRQSNTWNQLDVVVPWAIKAYQESRQHALVFSAEVTDHVVGMVTVIFRRENEAQERKEFVNLRMKTCTCLQWLNLGVPCGHAVQAGMKLGWTDNVAKWRTDMFDARYYINTYREAYQARIIPITTQFARHPTFLIKPRPLVHVAGGIGRPRTKRMLGKDERPEGDKRGRPGVFRGEDPVPGVLPLQPAPPPEQPKPKRVVRCSVCKREGHNKATCSVAQVREATPEEETIAAERMAAGAQELDAAEFAALARLDLPVDLGEMSE